MGDGKTILHECIEKDTNKKKTVSFFQITIEYKYNQNVSHSMPEQHSFKMARKDIAIICRTKDIEPGSYRRQAARDIVRRMQVELVKEFEQKIAQHDQIELHKLALDHLAELSHENKIMRHRYSGLSDLEEDIIVEFQKETVKSREKTKRNIRTLHYMIESNLFVGRGPKTKAVDKLAYDYLFAFADWLVVLQDNSDLAHFGFEGIGFEVTDQYNINTVIDDYQIEKIGQINKRRYEFTDYTIKYDETDSQYILKAGEAFEKDLGFSLPLFFDVLRCLQWHFLEEGTFTYIATNVVFTYIATNVVIVKKDEIIAKQRLFV